MNVDEWIIANRVQHLKQPSGNQHEICLLDIQHSPQISNVPASPWNRQWQHRPTPNECHIHPLNYLPTVPRYLDPTPIRPAQIDPNHLLVPTNSHPHFLGFALTLGVTIQTRHRISNSLGPWYLRHPPFADFDLNPTDVAKAEACFERALAVARKQQAKSWELPLDKLILQEAARGNF